jgi:hypothetical protein
MMRKSVIAAACVSIVIGSPASAQDTIAPPRTYISAEFGAQGLLGDLSKAEEGMYTQYRAKPGVVTLRNLTARWAPENSPLSYLLTGTNLGYNDMGLAARVNNPGLWDAQFRYDRSPHTYSGQWSSLYAETGTGMWTLSSRPATFSAWNTAAAGRVFTDPLRNQWDNAKLSFRFTPTEQLDSKLEYGMIKKAGDKPASFAWASPGGNSIEALMPLDNTTHDFRLSQSYGGRKFQLNAAYNLSMFSNNVTSLYADNQTQATDIAGMTSRGRMSDMPDNAMHAISLGGAYKLPYKTRVSGSYSWSVWNQDDDMLPAVNNSAITAANLALSAQNPKKLGGKAGTDVLALEVSSKPFDNLMNGMFKGVGLGAKFRRFEFRDETDVDSVWAFVSDAGNASVHHAERNPFRREERQVSANWKGKYPIAVGLEYEYEMLQANPQHANVFKTLETGPQVTFDFSGIEWMKFHARYSTTERRAEAFSFEGVYQGTWNPLPIEFDGFRNPLYADRDRTRFMTMVTVYPMDKVTFTGTFQNGTDQYLADEKDVTFGFQKFNNSMWGIDADYTPIPRLSLNAGYSLDAWDDQLQSRYRTPTNFANATYVWISQNDEETTTYYLGATGVILPGKIDGGFRFEHSFSKYNNVSRNPQAPTGGSAGDLANATVGVYPEITYKLQPMQLWASYRINSEWSTTLRFQTEKYDASDFRFAFDPATPTTAYRPTIANATSATGTLPQHVFLGNEYPSYNAQLITITMTYRPNLMRFGKPAL